MGFQDLHTTKLGNLGEKFIPEFARAKNAQAAKFVVSESTPVDSLCIMRDTLDVIAIEAKTKPHLVHRKYQGQHLATGMDCNDHATYMRMYQKEQPVNVCILFVDHLAKKMYYQWISVLDKHKERMNNLYIYPINKMKLYRDLTEEEVAELKGLSHTNEKYVQ